MAVAVTVPSVPVGPVTWICSPVTREATVEGTVALNVVDPLVVTATLAPLASVIVRPEGLTAVTVPCVPAAGPFGGVEPFDPVGAPAPPKPFSLPLPFGALAP